MRRVSLTDELRHSAFPGSGMHAVIETLMGGDVCPIGHSCTTPACMLRNCISYTKLVWS